MGSRELSGDMGIGNVTDLTSKRDPRKSQTREGNCKLERAGRPKFRISGQFKRRRTMANAHGETG